MLGASRTSLLNLDRYLNHWRLFLLFIWDAMDFIPLASRILVRVHAHFVRDVIDVLRSGGTALVIDNITQSL